MKIDSQLKKQIKNRVLTDLHEKKDQIITITTPYPMSEVDLALLYENFPDLKKYTIKNTIEKKIIGGMILQHLSTVIDVSLKSKIDAAVEKLITAI